METIKSKYFPRAVAVALALALLTAGCAGPETVPDAEMSPSQIATQEAERTQAEKERLSMQKAAAEELEGYRWPRESVWKTIRG